MSTGAGDLPDPTRQLQRSLRSRLAGGTLWALGARVAYALAALAVASLVTRLLPPVGAGTYFVALSVAAGLAVVGELGLRRVVVRFMSTGLAMGRPGEARRAALWGLCASGVAAVMLGAASASSVGVNTFGVLFDDTPLADVAALVGLLLVLRVLGVMRAEVFRGLQNFGRASWFDGVDWQVVTAALLFGLALSLPADATLDLVLGLTAAAWLPGLAIGAWMVLRTLRGLRGAGTVRAREMADAAWPLWLQDVALLLLSHADLWIVAAIVGATDAALYGVALRFLGLISFPLVMINAVLPPLISELHAKARYETMERLLRTAATLTLVPALAVTLTLIAGGGVILPVLFGDFYVSAWPIVAILACGQLVNVGVGSCALALTMTGHERAVMTISVGSAVLMTVGALLAASTFGSLGVATVAAAGLGLKHGMAWYVARRRVGVWTHAGWGEAREIARFAWTYVRRSAARD